MKDLTSTSYAVLGLLAIRPASSYELAKQVARGLRFTWPRAEGRIYDEDGRIASRPSTAYDVDVRSFTRPPSRARRLTYSQCEYTFDPVRREAPFGPKHEIGEIEEADMAVEAHEQLYRRWLYEVWGEGRYDVADELIAEDLVDHNAMPGQPAGRAGDIWAARAIRRAFPDLMFTADVVVSDGDLVVGRWTMTGTHTGPIDFMDLPPTGRPVTMTGQEIFRVEGGRFVEVWHQEDVPSMLDQLGLAPPPVMARLAAKRSAKRYKREQRKGGAPAAVAAAPAAVAVG